MDILSLLRALKRYIVKLKGGENVKETMLIYLPPELKEEVQILAVKEKTSASALAEEAFKRLLKQRKGGK